MSFVVDRALWDPQVLKPQLDLFTARPEFESLPHAISFVLSFQRMSFL